MLDNVIIKIECLGQFEEPIVIHKFRSMYLNAHKDYFEIIKKNGIDDLGKPANDPRITPFGKIMRKYFIDELPQFYDLSRGVISLVGIRPRSKDFWKNFSKKHKKRVLIYKPGLFGIHYSYTNMRDFQDLIQVDKEYLSRIEKGNKDKIDKEYLGKIFENIIFKGLRSR